MKSITILLFLPVFLCAQTTMHVESVTVVSPAQHQEFLEVTFTSHDPVRVDACTLEYSNSDIFQWIDYVAIYQDSMTLPVLSSVTDILYNPWVHYPGVYVGIGSDTVMSLHYVLDMHAYNIYSIECTLTCDVRHYVQESMPSSTLGPVTVTSPIITGVLQPEKYDDSMISVYCTSHGLHVYIDTRICEPVLVIDVLGRVVDQVYYSRDVYLTPGVYTLQGSNNEYRRTYIVP